MDGGTGMKPKKQWDHKWYTEEFLQRLKATAAVEMDGDLPYITKYAPDAGSPNGIAPRLLGGPMGKMARSTRLVPNFILDRVKIPITPKILAGFRAGCDRVSYAKCVQARIEVRDSTVPATDGYPIPIRMYNSAQCAPGCPCLYFIHGGAFVGGTLRPYDEGWKLFVEKFRMPVVAVDYRLLPEHPYPTLYDDCCRVLEWLGDDGARELHIDPRAVFVVGDSAGGNLAQGCATRYKGTHRVRGQLLLYPTLNLFGTTDRYYHPKETDYHPAPGQKKLAMGLVRQMELLSRSGKSFLGIPQPDDLCNPYTSDPAGNPPTFLSVGALDYLRNDTVAWAHKLHDAGVTTRLVMYNGMGHGFLNAMGVFPQAEDLLDEMGAFIQNVCKSHQ